MTFYFDMDGTLVDLYGYPQWLQCLRNNDVSPYLDAKPLCNMNTLARTLNKIQKRGHRICIISWLSKTPDPAFDVATEKAKRAWLKKHLKSVRFDEIHIVPYGTPKHSIANSAIGVKVLFDDDLTIRRDWSNGKLWHFAFAPTSIIKDLNRFA